MLSMMRFCRAAEIATCDISSEFSSAGRKHAAEFTTCAGGKHTIIEPRRDQGQGGGAGLS